MKLIIVEIPKGFYRPSSLLLSPLVLGSAPAAPCGGWSSTAQASPQAWHALSSSPAAALHRAPYYDPTPTAPTANEAQISSRKPFMKPGPYFGVGGGVWLEIVFGSLISRSDFLKLRCLDLGLRPWSQVEPMVP